MDVGLMKIHGSLKRTNTIAIHVYGEDEAARLRNGKRRHN